MERDEPNGDSIVNERTETRLRVSLAEIIGTIEGNDIFKG